MCNQHYRNIHDPGKLVNAFKSSILLFLCLPIILETLQKLTQRNSILSKVAELRSATFLKFHFHSFIISVKSKVLFGAVLELHVTDGWYLSEILPICFRLPCHPCAHICFSTDFNKNHLTYILGFLGKKVWWCSKILLIP